MSVPRDENNVPVVDSRFALRAEKLITFAGGTTNAIGDYDGTGDPFTIFTVTGHVMVRILAIVETDLAGATATLEVGVVGDTANLIAQSTATDIDASEIWHDATPDSPDELTSVMTEKIIANGKDIIGSVGTANITSGVIRFMAYWYPLSEGASVVAA